LRLSAPIFPETVKKRLSELEIISMKKARYWICLEWFEVDSDTVRPGQVPDESPFQTGTDLKDYAEEVN